MKKILILLLLIFIPITIYAARPKVKPKSVLPLEVSSLNARKLSQLPIGVTSAIERYQNWAAVNNVPLLANPNTTCTVSPSNMVSIISRIGGPMEGFHGQGSYDMKCIGSYSGCSWLVLLSVVKWEPFVGYYYVRQDCSYHSITCGGPQNLYKETGSEFDPIFDGQTTYYCMMDIWLGNCTTGGTTLIASEASLPYTFP